MSKPKRVVIIHKEGSNMDQVLAGIDEVRRDGHNWYVHHQYQAPRDADEVAGLLAFNPDGMISVADNLPCALRNPRFPWVSVRNQQSPLAVVPDDHAAGVCAAEHLAGLGTPVLAQLTSGNDGWQRTRREGFRAGAARYGRQVVILTWAGPGDGGGQHQHFLAQVAALAKPAAIFAGNDWFAFEAMEALISAGMRIPADIALLGADDVPRCSASTVPLSSVRIPHYECGRRAALLLAEAFAGQSRAPVTITVAPQGVAERASTDAIAIRDPEVAALLRFIRVRVGEPFTVGDVVAASSLGRRSLELRFRRLLGCTMLEAIHRCRIEHAKTMLRTADRPITDIATACGFTDAPHFTLVFRKVVGLPPSAWRARERALDAG